MIPRLLPANATNFSLVGIPLTDAISCVVTEERNGAFELEMVVSTTTPYFEELKEGKLIIAKPNHTQTPQAFEIYEITKPILQRVTVRAQHISYRLSFIPVKPFSCTGITDTLTGLVDNSLETNPFTFTTTLTNEESTYNQIVPASLRSRLGGVQGSVLDVFGGEYEWDNFTVSLKLHRGADNGVELRVAKNISALEQTTSLETVVTGAIGYYVSDDGLTALYGDVQYNSNVSDYAYPRTVLVDLSELFESAPSRNELNTAALNYVNSANLGTINTNVKLTFVDLADTEEYKNSPLERVNLCDTLSVIYNPLSIYFKAKANKLTFDVLAERTLEIEIGDARTTLTDTVSDLIGDISSTIVGDRIVSVSQKVDRELGTITQKITTVETDLYGDDENEAKYYTKTEADSKITQTSQAVTLDFYENNIQGTLEGVVESVSDLETWITFDLDGMSISNSDSDIKSTFSWESLDFTDTSTEPDERVAWISAREGIGGNEFSIGNPEDMAERWRIYTRDSGKHLTFTRRSGT